MLALDLGRSNNSKGEGINSGAIFSDRYAVSDRSQVNSNRAATAKFDNSQLRKTESVNAPEYNMKVRQKCIGA